MKLLALLLVAVSAAPVEAATYYVHGRYDRSSNTATGKSFHAAGADTPWRSISKANAVLVAGDTVIILSLNPSDSALAVSSNPLVYHNVINPANNGDSTADGRIVYWGADTIGCIASGSCTSNDRPDPLWLPVKGTSRPTLTKRGVTIRGVNLSRGMAVDNGTGGVGFVHFQACSARTDTTLDTSFKFRGLNRSRMDSCTFRLKIAGTGTSANSTLLWFENGYGGYNPTAQRSEYDTLAYNSIRIERLRNEPWGIALHHFTHNLWVHNNDFLLSFTTALGSGGQRPVGFMFEESMDCYWYNNTITFRAVGGQAGEIPILFFQRSGSRRHRFQGNTISCFYDTPYSWRWYLVANSCIDGTGCSDGAARRAAWNQYYGVGPGSNVLEQANSNSWINNTIKMQGPTGGSTTPAITVEQIRSLNDSIVGNTITAKECVPFKIQTPGMLSGTTIEHNTIFALTYPALLLDLSSCPGSSNGRIRYNVFYKSTVSCATNSAVNLLEINPGEILYDYNGFYSGTNDSSSATRLCSSCVAPSGLGTPNWWVNPTFTTVTWPPNLTTTTNAVNRGPDNYIGSTPHPVRPAPLQSLTAGTPTASDVRISWVPTGADSLTGTGSYYAVRYSTSPINTESDWSGASGASGTIPTPVASLSATQDMTVESLTPGTIYYIAVRLYNWANNPSAIVSTTFTTAGGEGGEAPP